MIKNCLSPFLTVLLAVFFVLPARAASTNESYSSTTDPRSNLSTIFFTGVGGAVLGLSTLSFYGRPEKHMPNIAIGFAVGIIFGAGYTTFQAAKRPEKADPLAEFVPTAEREMAMNSGRPQHMDVSSATPAGWSWSF